METFFDFAVHVHVHGYTCILYAGDSLHDEGVPDASDGSQEACEEHAWLYQSQRGLYGPVEVLRRHPHC